MQKLVVSFSGSLYAIKSGRLTANDLQTAILYFGCTRKHALTPGANGEYNELELLSQDEDEVARIHSTLVTAIKQAEKEGRIAWRTLDTHSNYEGLNALLVANGIEPLQIDDWSHYSYPNIEHTAQEQGLPLEVIWRG